MKFFKNWIKKLKRRKAAYEIYLEAIERSLIAFDLSLGELAISLARANYGHIDILAVGECQGKDLRRACLSFSELMSVIDKMTEKDGDPQLEALRLEAIAAALEYYQLRYDHLVMATGEKFDMKRESGFKFKNFRSRLLRLSKRGENETSRNNER